MPDPSTSRRSVLAAGIAALFGLIGRRPASAQEQTWELSVTSKEVVEPNVYLFPEMYEVELECGGAIVLMNDLLTSDDCGRAVTWRESSKRPIVGLAKTSAVPGGKLIALLPRGPIVCE